MPQATTAQSKLGSFRRQVRVFLFQKTAYSNTAKKQWLDRWMLQFTIILLLFKATSCNDGLNFLLILPTAQRIFSFFSLPLRRRTLQIAELLTTFFKLRLKLNSLSHSHTHPLAQTDTHTHTLSLSFALATAYFSSVLIPTSGRCKQF